MRFFHKAATVVGIAAITATALPQQGEMMQGMMFPRAQRGRADPLVKGENAVAVDPQNSADQPGRKKTNGRSTGRNLRFRHMGQRSDNEGLMRRGSAGRGQGSVTRRFRFHRSRRSHRFSGRFSRGGRFGGGRVSHSRSGRKAFFESRRRSHSKSRSHQWSHHGSQHHHGHHHPFIFGGFCAVIGGVVGAAVALFVSKRSQPQAVPSVPVGTVAPTKIVVEDLVPQAPISAV